MRVAFTAQSFFFLFQRISANLCENWLIALHYFSHVQNQFKMSPDANPFLCKAHHDDIKIEFLKVKSSSHLFFETVGKLKVLFFF